MKAKALNREALRYIPAGKVRCGGTPLPRLTVRNGAESLGKLEIGVLPEADLCRSPGPFDRRGRLSSCSRGSDPTYRLITLK